MSASVPRLFVRAVLARDGKFLAVTLASCAVAAIVAMFQYSVYTSFLRASAVVPRMLGGDFWITSASVECFDFPYQFSQDYEGALSRYVPGANFRRVVFGFATWRSPQGRRGNVAVVGVDGTGLPDDGFAADRSDLARLDLSALGFRGMECLDPGQKAQLHRLMRDRESTGNHGLAGNDRGQRCQTDQCRQRPARRLQIERIRRGTGAVQDQRPLSQIADRKGGHHQRDPGDSDRFAPEMAHIGIKRLGPGNRQGD